MHEVSPMTIRKEAEVYAKQQVASQQELFKQFGIMSGWSNDTTYRTLGTRPILPSCCILTLEPRSRLRDAATIGIPRNGQERHDIPPFPPGTLLAIFEFCPRGSGIGVQGQSCVAFSLCIL